MINSELRQVEQIFHVAVSLDRDERADYLDSACRDDRELRHEVESLVSAFESGSDLLEEGAVTLAMKVIGSNDTDSMVGEQVGAYRIISRIGRGGMGAVYLAEDTRLNRKVALKFLSSDFVTDNWAKRQLIREAQAVAMLDHPNICPVYGYEELEGHSFIVMQYIEGKTLADVIRAKALDSGKIIALAHQIVSALAHAHAHGIIHRDVKPRNIMITSSGQAKVLDFGLAKSTHKSFEDAGESLSQLSRDGLLVGTIAYMSPEQLRGERLDYRSDIFSLGTVLYEMACGRNPHAQKTNAEVISAIMTHEPKSLRHVAVDCPPNLEHIITKCLRKDRAERYQSATELLIDLENIEKGVAIQAAISPYLNFRSAALAASFLLIFAASTYFYKSWGSVNHRLAVLPIVCEDADPNSPCLGPAITENLVKTLEHRRGLRVTSSHVAPSLYGPQAASPEKVGRDLSADTVLFGRIRRGEHGLVLTTRLQNVTDGSRIAEDSYPVDPEKLSLLGQQLSLDTAFQLQLPTNEDDKNLLSVLAAQQNRNAEAVDLYRKGRYYWSKRDRQNIQIAIDNFRQATDKDPLFALAWAGLADCYVLMNTPAVGPMASKEAMNKAEYAAKQALSIDDNLAEAHNAYAAVLMKGHWDWENAEKEFKRAIAVSPDYSPAHWGYSNLLATTGRLSESLVESKLARDLDPFSAPAIMNYCRTLYFARQFNEANVCLNELEQEQPNYSLAKYMHGIVDIEIGNTPEAIRIYEQIYDADKVLGGAMLGFCYGIANRPADAERVLDEMREVQKQELQKQHYMSDHELGIIYLGMNDLDHAFPLFQKAVDEKFPPAQSIFVSAMFDRLRPDPRFARMAREVKLPLPTANAPVSSAMSAK